jgi:hypothetical protein
LLAVFEAYVEFLADVAIEGGDFTAARGGDFEGEADDVSGRGCGSARGCSFHKNEFGLIEFNFYRCDFCVPYHDYITLFNGTCKRIFEEVSLVSPAARLEKGGLLLSAKLKRRRSTDESTK